MIVSFFLIRPFAKFHCECKVGGFNTIAIVRCTRARTGKVSTGYKQHEHEERILLTKLRHQYRLHQGLSNSWFYKNF